MSGPTIVTVRPGVQFTPDAAASFRRLEHRLGRQVDVNSTYRDWDLQLRMYNDWRAYVNGTGPKPNHSRAVHPKYSVHCQGRALDSDDWRTPGFIALAAEYGWIRTAAADPTEQHHFEYIASRDQHRNDPTPTTTTPAPPEEEEDEMKNSGVYYVPTKGTVIYLLFNTGSGWYHEYSNGNGNGPMPGPTYNNPLAATLATGSFAKITPAHARVLKQSLDAVRRTAVTGQLDVNVGEPS